MYLIKPTYLLKFFTADEVDSIAEDGQVPGLLPVGFLWSSGGDWCGEDMLPDAASGQEPACFIADCRNGVNWSRWGWPDSPW